MSFAPKAAPVDKLTSNVDGRSATLSPRKPVPLVLGRGRTAVEWKTPILNWSYRKGTQSAFAFASIYGWIGLGPADEIAEIIINGKGYSVVDKWREDTTADYVDHVIPLETPSTWRFWWGQDEQDNYASYLDSLILDSSHPMKGKAHPSYKGVFAVAIKDLDCGRADQGETPPLPQVEIAWSRRSPTAYSFGYAAHGTHPIGIVKDILTLKRGGLALPASYFDDTHWSDQMTRLFASGLAGITGTNLFVSRVFADAKPASQQAQDVLDHIGGFMFERDGKVCVDWSPMDGSTTDPSSLRTLSIHHMVGQPSIEPDDLSQMTTQVIVTGLDWHANPQLTEASEAAQVPYARELLGEERPPAQINRPGWCTRDQLKNAANLEALLRANPGLEFSSKFLRHYATHPDGSTPLRPGDRFVLSWSPVGLSVVMRVTERSDETPTSVQLRAKVERGAFPQPFVPELDPRADITRPPPPDLARFCVAQLPPDLSDAADTLVAALAERPNNNAYGFQVQFSPTDSWPGQTIDSGNIRWAVGALLAAGLTLGTSDTTLTVDNVGVDWDKLASQSTLEQGDDTLLLYSEGEWFSIGTITPLGGGTYTLDVKRARLGSLPAAHADNGQVFIIARADLVYLSNADFASVESGGVYDSTTATKWFKLRSFNADADGNWSSATSLTLRDPTPDTPTGLAAATGTGKLVKLTWSAVTASLVNEYSVYRATGPGYSDEAVIGWAPAATVPSFTDVGVALGTTYRYRVKAHATDETVSGFSSSVTATPSTVSAGSVDQTAPSTPSAPTYSSEGTYLSDDGAVLSYIVLTLPSLPTGAIGLNVLYRQSTSDGYVIGQQVGAGGGTAKIDDLTPGASYQFAVQAFSVFGVLSTISSTLTRTAAGKTSAPTTPTGGSISATGVTPKYIPGSSAFYFGTNIGWSPIADKDLAYYEVKATFTNSDSATDYSWLPQDGVNDFVRTAQPHAMLYNSTLQAGYVRVRSVDRSGNASAWAYIGNANSAASLGAGSIAADDRDDVTTTGIKIGGGTSTTKVLARYQVATVVTLTGGSAYEDFDVNLSGRGFSTRPDIGATDLEGVITYKATYLANDSLSTSTNARVRVFRYDGANTTAGSHILMAEFTELD